MGSLNRVVDYLKKNKSLTVAEAKEELGTTELRKIISTLRDKGYKITDEWQEGVNRFGDVTRFKRYFLISEPVVVNNENVGRVPINIVVE